jgi:hypothetical protein
MKINRPLKTKWKQRSSKYLKCVPDFGQTRYDRPKNNEVWWFHSRWPKVYLVFLRLTSAACLRETAESVFHCPFQGVCKIGNDVILFIWNEDLKSFWIYSYLFKINIDHKFYILSQLLYLISLILLNPFMDCAEFMKWAPSINHVGNFYDQSGSSVAHWILALLSLCRRSSPTRYCQVSW